MEFFVFFALVFLSILGCLLTHDVQQIKKRLSDGAYWLSLARSAREASNPEKNVDTIVEDVEDSNFGCS